MRSLKFEGCTHAIAGTQKEYGTLHDQLIDGSKGEFIMIFELTDEEVEEIVITKKLVYRQLTFGNQYQPMNILVHWPDENVPELLPDLNNDPKLN
jgi:hypothetical protein